MKINLRAMQCEAAGTIDHPKKLDKQLDSINFYADCCSRVPRHKFPTVRNSTKGTIMADAVVIDILRIATR